MGIVVKLVKVLEIYAMEVDFKLANEDIGLYKQILELKQVNDNLEETCEALLDVINLAAINGDDVDNDYQPEIDEIDTQIEANEEEINRLRKV